MLPLAEIGNLIEVTPLDEIQYRTAESAAWSFINDPTPFRFRVEGMLIDNGFFYGLHGAVLSGPDRYLGLICNIMIRYDGSDWMNAFECGASFKVGPSVARRSPDYDPKDHSNIPFHLHPDGVSVEGFPKISRFGRIQTIIG